MFQSLEEILQITYQNDSKLFKTISKLDFMEKWRTLHNKNENTTIKPNKRILEMTITLIHSSEV